MDEKFEYEIVGWPEVQDMMNVPGFRESSSLIEPNEEIGIGEQTYLVDKEWLDMLKCCRKGRKSEKIQNLSLSILDRNIKTE